MRTVHKLLPEACGRSLQPNRRGLRIKDGGKREILSRLRILVSCLRPRQVRYAATLAAIFIFETLLEIAGAKTTQTRALPWWTSAGCSVSLAGQYRPPTEGGHFQNSSVDSSLNGPPHGSGKAHAVLPTRKQSRRRRDDEPRLLVAGSFCPKRLTIASVETFSHQRSRNRLTALRSTLTGIREQLI